MKRIVEYFDRSYIINLSDRPDRRRQVEREFLLAGVNVPSERVHFYTAFRPADKGGFADIGTRGCFTSHRNVLALAHRDHLRNVLVFEDDVSFRSVGTSFERQLLKQLSSEDWDVVFFGYALPPEEALKGLKGPLTRWPNDIMCTHFLAVNGRFIKSMVQYMDECESRPRGHPAGGPMPADGAYNHVRYINPNINLLISIPSLALQRSSRTDVAQNHFLDRAVWLRPILRGMRAIVHRQRMTLDKIKLRRQLDRQD
jgi:glycosyl transferase, family 25